MAYPYNIDKRVKYLESLPKLTKTQQNELKLLNIVLENNAIIATRSIKDPEQCSEMVRYLKYCNEIVLDMLKNGYY